MDFQSWEETHSEERLKDAADKQNQPESGEDIGPQQLGHVGVSGDVPHQGRYWSFFVDRVAQLFVLGVEQWQDTE